MEDELATSENYVCLIESFSKYVAETPEAIALCFKGNTLSYRDLDLSSSRLAASLLAKGVRTGDRIVVLATRNLELVVFFLAILKAGACYVPVDLESLSEERIRSTIEFVEPKLVISSSPKDICGVQTLVWNGSYCSEGELSAIGSRDFPIRTKPSDLAYIVFTSGTTSEQKGVMIPRRALSNYVLQGGKDAPFNMNVSSSDTVLLIFSPAFDGIGNSCDMD